MNPKSFGERCDHSHQQDYSKEYPARSLKMSSPHASRVSAIISCEFGAYDLDISGDFRIRMITQHRLRGLSSH
jgi:hypothetical protein